MPPPTKGGAMPTKSGKGSIRRSHGVLSAGKGKGKGGANSSAGTGTKAKKSRKVKKTGRKTQRQKQQQQWHYYINKVRRSSTTNKNYSLSRKAMSVLGSFVEDMFERIASEAVNVAQISKVKTLTGREIQMAARLLMGGELLKYGMCEGTRAVHSYNTNFSALMESRNTQAI